jgi:aryl-alcohol dehydrogenase-like predicted oxidoreductase
MQDVVYDIQSDFFQYIAVKHALMSGGINHIDTGYNFRNQQSDRVVGQVLRTLINKYGYDRE